MVEYEERRERERELSPGDLYATPYRGRRPRGAGCRNWAFFKSIYLQIVREVVKVRGLYLGSAASPSSYNLSRKRPIKA